MLGIPGLVVLPGGVKKEPRIATKAFLKYGGDFSRVQDMSWITMTVATLDQLADVVEALQEERALCRRADQEPVVLPPSFTPSRTNRAHPRAPDTGTNWTARGPTTRSRSTAAPLWRSKATRSGATGTASNCTRQSAWALNSALSTPHTAHGGRHAPDTPVGNGSPKSVAVAVRPRSARAGPDPPIPWQRQPHPVPGFARLPRIKPHHHHRDVHIIC